MIDLITTATAEDEKRRAANIAVLPIGSFEQHGSFLPLITDTVVACAIVQELAKAYPVMPLPPITASCSHEHAAWRGTVSISARTLHRIISDITESLTRSGIGRIVLVNGHGGNYVLSNVVQEHTAAHGPTMSLFPLGHEWTKARVEAGMETSGPRRHARRRDGDIAAATRRPAARARRQRDRRLDGEPSSAPAYARDGWLHE